MCTMTLTKQTLNFFPKVKLDFTVVYGETERSASINKAITRQRP